jgi:hypothetical protein
LSWQFKKNKNPNFETSLLGHSTLSICSQYLKRVYAVVLGRTFMTTTTLSRIQAYTKRKGKRD